MGRNDILFGLLVVQILLFSMALISRFRDKKMGHYFILFLLTSIMVTHIIAYHTDSEDIYISLRYVKNFVEGKGLVFNTFDRVEGYSDFLWVLLIAAVYKVLHSDIPLTARLLSLFFSVIALWYTYYLALLLTRNKLLAYLAAFIVSVSGSFACYGLAGLENPLYALFMLWIIHAAYQKKWALAGLLIGLMTMTRPEGFIIYLPLAMYIFLQDESWGKMIRSCLIVAAVAALPVIPWTIWRVSYYGYLIPNTIAAKEGMDIVYQLKIGITYSLYFLIIISESLLVLCILPVIHFIFSKGKLRMTGSNALYLFLLATAAIFTAFYTFAGGDWMPGWRFYASLIPLFSLILVIGWKVMVFDTGQVSVLRSPWIVLIFAFSGYVQVRNSFMNPNLIPLVDSWRDEVEGLKTIGNWFHRTLPSNTLIATFPNGAFSYYNELPTIDYGGLTDNQVGRFGHKKKIGRPGHIAENPEYVLSRKPEIIAILDGQGFVKHIDQQAMFPGYQPLTFIFNDYHNPCGDYINLHVRADRVESIKSYLLQDKQVQLYQARKP